MPDHGHTLEFGAFITPDGRNLDGVLELVQLAEVSGLDLASFQDHPYQARHVDTWTLLSVLGARTSAIKLAPNVASLPLRPPVVLAKSAATLDRITSGRVELGLGAGAFWDAIVAAGGPRRTPKQAVDALIEAIGVLREFWSGGPVRRDGEYYPVQGLKAGPTPAHEIPIGVGAYGPRMLRVTGELADAWVPSMGFADPPRLRELTPKIDKAAADTGRGPEQVRRIYNINGSFGAGSGFLQGRPADWAEQLADLTLELGIGTFVLAADDPTTMRTFAEEVAPAVRETVESERARPAGRSRSAGGGDAAAAPGSGGRAAAESTGGAPTQAGAEPTPDAGEQFTTMPWDEATRPTTGEPTDAHYTAAQLAAPQHLIDVHDQLRAELTPVRDIVGQVRSGDTTVAAARSAINAMTMRQNNWTLGAYCQSYCRAVSVHHTLEDRQIFPHLRRSERGLGAVMDRLEEEHHVIADVLDRVDEALVSVVTGDGGGRALDDLQHEVDVLTDTMLSHLAYEERELRGPLARYGLN